MKKLRLYNEIINFKLNIIKYIIIFIFFLYCFFLFKIMIIDKDKYSKLLFVKTNKIYTGKLGERGNIYDRNGKLLVGNKEIPIIIYEKGISNDEINNSYELARNIDIDFSNLTDDMKREYFLNNNYNLIYNRINDNIKNKYKNREIDEDEFKELMYMNIHKSEIELMDQLSCEAAYIYYLMNKGYYYENKIIKNDNVSDSEIDYIKNNNLGFKIDIRYERIYPYGNTLKGILGTLGNIPKEEVNDYLDNGYNLDSIVGISFLESEYENYLKGINETYKISSNGEKIKLTDSKPGNDIYLSIDIDLQNDIENIIIEEMSKAKKERNTEFYNKVYSIITDTSDGGILALSGIRYENDTKSDNSIGTVVDAITPGSIVKGASHLLGYKTGSITFGTTVTDGCIYVKNTPKKCSWKKLGILDDLKALKYSSNYYQYLIAINIGGGKYIKNGPLSLNKEGFNVYRKFFNEFGLGVKTGIDLPIEMIGFIGNDSKTGNILDFPIGQYDTYTPIGISQYITTLANNGIRIKPHLLKYVKDKFGNIIYEYKREELNKISVEDKYIERVQTGLKMVMESGGTGSGYINLKYDPYGKTGTAQSFIDTNNDKVIDHETISTAFVGYASDTSFVVLSPHVSSLKTHYTSSVNKRITRKITDLYFQKYN